LPDSALSFFFLHITTKEKAADSNKSYGTYLMHPLQTYKYSVVNAVYM
jgi:hypothetical protein